MNASVAPTVAATQPTCDMAGAVGWCDERPTPVAEVPPECRWLPAIEEQPSPPCLGFSSHSNHSLVQILTVILNLCLALLKLI